MNFNSVADRSKESQRMLAAFDLVDHLNGGTEEMRKQGQKYLPKRPLEDDEDYQARLDLSTLYPAFSETMIALVGRAFSKPLSYSENMEPFLREEVIMDIDLQGRDLPSFARDWFEEGLRYGLTHAMIEAPDKEYKNLEEQKADKARPYVIQINPRRILGWKQEKGELTQLRVEFDEEENKDQFSTHCVNRIRVYEKDVITTYIKGTAGDWQLDPNNPVKVNRAKKILLVTLYTKRTGFMTAEPPLKELAYLNSKHWRLQSGNDVLVDKTSVPILMVSGINTGDNLVIGASHAVKLPTGADMKFVEHTGQAVKVGRDSLIDLKEEMRQAGAKLLQPNTQTNKTATQSREDSARENSQLGAMCVAASDALNKMLNTLAATRNVEDAKAECKLQPNLDPDFTPHETIKLLVELWKNGLISGETVFEEAQRRGILNELLKFEDEQTAIAMEMSKLGLAPPTSVVPGEEGEEEEEEELDEDGEPVKKKPVKKKPAAPPKPPKE